MHDIRMPAGLDMKAWVTGRLVDVEFELRGTWARRFGPRHELVGIEIEADLGFGWIRCLVEAMGPTYGMSDRTRYVLLHANDHEAIRLAFGWSDIGHRMKGP